jgi:N-acetylornithine carbamoyltransferase
MQITLAHPLGFEIDHEVLDKSKAAAQDAGGSLQVVNDMHAAVRGAEVLYARSWGSTKFWHDAEREAQVKRSLQGWRVDEQLMATTNNALLMHPLPVRRNVAATDAVLDGKQSVIYEQAANRAHVQKALLMHLLK